MTYLQVSAGQNDGSRSIPKGEWKGESPRRILAYSGVSTTKKWSQDAPSPSDRRGSRILSGEEHPGKSQHQVHYHEQVVKVCKVQLGDLLCLSLKPHRDDL